MECEKASSTAAFSRKLRNGHSQSFSFSGSAIYDGVFASPAKKKSSAVDYGEIFRGSGASIPFLEVPELNEKKIKVDVRRSKLDYSTVFGGFEKLDFAVSHEELIVKPKKRSTSSSREWESKKTELNSNIASPAPKEVESSPSKNKVSSPEALHQSTRPEQLNMSYRQTNVNGGNGTAHIAQFGAVSDHTRMVDGPCPLQNKVSSPEALHQSTSAEQLNVSYQKTSLNGGSGTAHIAQFGTVSDTRMVDGPRPLQKAESNSSSVPSAIHKPSIKTLVEENSKKSRSESSDVHHSVASSRRSSKTDSEFQNIAGQNEYSVNDKLFQAVLETSDNNDQSKMPTPSILQKNLSNSEAGSERPLGKNLGVCKSSPSEDTDVPGSPPYFDEEADVNSSAVASAAAAKKAIEEAQLSIKIAKEIMERKTAGFYSSRKQKFCDGGKAVEKRKIGKDGGSIREKERKDLCEEVHSSRQTSPIEAEEHARKARNLWEVPGGFSKSAVDHKQQEAEKCKTMQLVDERPKKPRKLWEIPGGFLKATLGHKVEEAEKYEGAEDGNNPRAEAQSVDESRWEAKAIAGNTFFKLEQLGNKIKNVAVTFAGNKDQKDDEAGGRRCNTTECSDSSKLPDKDLNQASETETISASALGQDQENFLVAPQLETCEPADILVPIKTVKKTEEDNHIEHIDKLLQDPLQKQEKETEFLEQDVIASESESVPNKTETEMRFNEASGQREFSMTSEEVYEIVKFREKYAKACELGEDKEELRGSYSEGDVNDRSDEAQDFKRVDIMLNNTSNSEETDNITRQVGDSGLHENWNMLKQMFRQMFQTVDSKRDEEICHIAKSGQMYLEVDQRAEAENNISTNNDESDTANQQDEIETVSPESEEPCIDNKVTENLKLSLEVVYNEESDQTAGEARAYSVNKLTEEGVEAIEACNEEERIQFVAKLPQRVFTLYATKEQARLPTEILGIDQSEMDSSDSDMQSEQIPCEQNSESGRFVSENENDGEESSFESELGDGGVEIADFEPTYPDETSTASSMGEQVEELSSESQENGEEVEIERIHKQVKDVNAHKQVEDVNVHKQVEDVNAHKQVEDVAEDNLSGYIKEAETDQSPCKSDECEEPSEASEKSETCQGTEDNGDFLKEEEYFKTPKADELHSRNDSEGSESHCLSEAGIGLEEEVSKTRPENKGEKQKESLKKEGVTKEPPQREAKTKDEHLKKIDEAKEREKEKEKERIMVERAIREARERAFAEARERAEKAAIEKATKEARRRTTAEARGRSEKTSVEFNEKQSSVDKASVEARLRAERAAVERALAEARERALERALSEKTRNQAEKSFGYSTREKQNKGSDNSRSSGQSNAPNHNANGEPAQRSKARSERNQRTMESAAKALAEKKMRDLVAQKEEAERNRLAETLDAEVKRWSSGKEGNLRALLSTLHYILGPECGWKPVPLTDLVPSAAVRKAYRRATLYVHPDKLQQRGAGTQQKYTCEKVFDLLKEAWNKFSADER